MALIAEATKRWAKYEGDYRDDITAIVLTLPLFDIDFGSGSFSMRDAAADAPPAADAVPRRRPSDEMAVLWSAVAEQAHPRLVMPGRRERRFPLLLLLLFLDRERRRLARCCVRSCTTTLQGC